MASTWTSTSWNGYASYDTHNNGGHTLFIGCEWHGDRYHYRSARILFTTPNVPIGKISFTGKNTSGYFTYFNGSSDNKNLKPKIYWKITSTSDYSCKTDPSSYHGTITYTRNTTNDCFKSDSSVRINL